MLWTIAVILLVLWALGMVSSYTAAGPLDGAAVSCLRDGGGSAL